MENSKDPCDLVNVEAELSSGSVQEWLSIVKDGKKMEKGSRRSDLSTKVKKHLSALGWSFYYFDKGKKRELRYKSPNGKCFYSLATACLHEDSRQQQLVPSNLNIGSSDQSIKIGEISPVIENSTKKILQVKKRLRRKAYDQDKKCEVCCVCHWGGELLLCDGCPSAFHQTCIGLLRLPKEELWFCPCCCCDVCGSMNSSAGNTMLMSCEQCQRRFHLNCLKEESCTVSCRGWFCSSQCSRVFSGLQHLIGSKITVGEGDMVWTLLRAPNEDQHYDDEHISKLDSAVEILHHGFEPTKDSHFSGKDLVEELILRGFYTVLIERNKKPITAAALRVDKDVAEIPLVATLSSYKRIWMCRMLMDELEKQMSQMGVCRLVLPAAEEAVTTWTQGFGFSVMESSERLEFVKHGVLDFVGTVMCHKFLIKSKKIQESQALRSTNQDA